MPCGPSVSVGRDRRGCVSARKHACGLHLLPSSPPPHPPKLLAPCPALQIKGVGGVFPALLQCHGATTTMHQPEREKGEQPGKGDLRLASFPPLELPAQGLLWPCGGGKGFLQMKASLGRKSTPPSSAISYSSLTGPHSVLTLALS